jgi:UDP-glucose 4-epimerase
MTNDMTISLQDCISNLAGSRVLVTGGAGFIGSHLVDYLIEHGVAQVKILDSLSRARGQWLAERRDSANIRFIEGDIRDETLLETALSGVEVVFHLAAVATVMNAVRDPMQAFAVNAMATGHLALAAQRAGVRRLVFASSREVYGDPQTLPVTEDARLAPKNVYGASKAAGEMFLSTIKPDSLEVVILRLANAYGPGDTGRVIPIFLDNVMRGLPLVLYGGGQSLDLIWIGDIVETLVKSGFSDKPVQEPVNVGSGCAIPLKMLAERIVAQFAIAVEIQIAPPRGPEVERFEADLTRAQRYFGLARRVDPLDRLAELIAILQSTHAPDSV